MMNAEASTSASPHGDVLHLVPIEDQWQQGGITGIISKPDLTFKQATAALRLCPSFATLANNYGYRGGSPAASSLRSCSSSAETSMQHFVSDEDSRSGDGSIDDYFSYSLSQPSGHWPNLQGYQSDASGTSTPRSHCLQQLSSHYDVEMAHLMDDAALMLGGAASRWKKVAITMPRSCWKANQGTSSSSCDHRLLDFACEKPFGRFLAGYRVPELVNTTAVDPQQVDVGNESSSSSNRLLVGLGIGSLIKANKRTSCWRCGNCFCDDHSSRYATLILDDQDAPPQLKAPLSAVEEVDLLAIAELEEESEKLSLLAAEEIKHQKRSNTDAFQATVPTSLPTQLPSAASALAQCLGRSPQTLPTRKGGRWVNGQTAATAASSSSSSSSSSTTPPASTSSSSSTSVSSNNSNNGCRSSPRPPSIGLSFFPRSEKSTSVSSWYNFSLNGSRSSPSSSPSLSVDAGSTTTTPSPPIPSFCSPRMTVLPDGRYLVRERVCDRCSHVVEQERSRTVQRQEDRRRPSHHHHHQQQQQHNYEDEISRNTLTTTTTTTAMDTLATVAQLVGHLHASSVDSHEQQQQHHHHGHRHRQRQQRQRSTSSDSAAQRRRLQHHSITVAGVASAASSSSSSPHLHHYNTVGRRTSLDWNYPLANRALQENAWRGSLTREDDDEDDGEEEGEGVKQKRTSQRGSSRQIRW